MTARLGMTLALALAIAACARSESPEGAQVAVDGDRAERIAEEEKAGRSQDSREAAEARGRAAAVRDIAEAGKALN